MPVSPLAAALADATQKLTEAGVPSPRIDAELLAAHLLAESAGRVRALALTDIAAPAGLEELVAERARRIPLQHITGKAYFRHLELSVGPGVFIPRPETEIVAQLVIDQARRLIDAAEETVEDTEQRRIARPRIVDLGTGSGAIAAAVAQEVPGTEVCAVELDPLAHSWAERNLAPLGVRLELGDLRNSYAGEAGSFDIVVSNPPYIPAGAVPREPEVAEHDPAAALYGGGADGMELPLAAIAAARRLLKPGGMFVLEHAEVQAGSLRRELEADPSWGSIGTHLDLNERERATSAVLQRPVPQ